MADHQEDLRDIEQMGAIDYPDSSVLLRPQTITGPARIVALIIVAAAAILGIFALQNVANNVIFASAIEQKAIEDILANDPKYNLPNMVECAGLDEASVHAQLEATTTSLYDVPSTNDTTLDVIKLNDGITAEQASALYVAGGKGVSGKQAVSTLYGSWRFDMDRSAATVWRLRYADFTSGSPDAAIRTLMAAQGLGDDSVVDAGLDEAGNTYRAGTFVKGDVTYHWRISSINLNEIYSVTNLPSTAMYVGMRVTAA